MNIVQASAMLSNRGIRCRVVTANQNRSCVGSQIPKLGDWNQYGGTAAVCMRYVCTVASPENNAQAQFEIRYFKGDADNGHGVILYTIQAIDLFRWFDDPVYASDWPMYFNGTVFTKDRQAARPYTAKQALIALREWFSKTFNLHDASPEKANRPENASLVTEQHIRKLFRKQAIKNIARLPSHKPVTTEAVLEAVFGTPVPGIPDTEIKRVLADLLKYTVTKLTTHPRH